MKLVPDTIRYPIQTAKAKPGRTALKVAGLVVAFIGIRKWVS